MALGLKTTGGDWFPIVKYDARDGRFIRVDREQTASGSWETRNVDITSDFTCIADLENLEVGYAAFSATGPDFRMVPLGSPLPEPPTDKHRPCFRMKIRLANSCGGDLREWASVAKCVLAAVDVLHDAYLAAPEAKEGKPPIIRMTGTTPIESRSKQGATISYSPNLEIVGWAERAVLEGGSTDTSPPLPPSVAPAVGAHDFG